MSDIPLAQGRPPGLEQFRRRFLERVISDPRLHDPEWAAREHLAVLRDGVDRSRAQHPEASTTEAWAHTLADRIHQLGAEMVEHGFPVSAHILLLAFEQILFQSGNRWACNQALADLTVNVYPEAVPPGTPDDDDDD